MPTVEKPNIIAEYKTHEKDTGSSEVQVALLTARINHLKTLENKPHLRFRVMVKGGGCSGFQYEFALDDGAQHVADGGFIFGSGLRGTNLRERIDQRLIPIDVAANGQDGVEVFDSDPEFADCDETFVFVGKGRCC